jgi:hypothetical protein
LDGFHVEVPLGLTFLNSLNSVRSKKFRVDRLASNLKPNCDSCVT